MILTAGALAGCAGADPASTAGGECPAVEAPSTGNAAPPNETPPQNTTDLAACSGGVSQDQINKELQIAQFLNNDFHEMIVCGGLANRFAYDLLHFFASIGCGKPTAPVGLLFGGLGLFLSGGVMRINVKLAKDSPLGLAGDPVPFDLFDIGSYGAGIAVKAEITADTSWSTDNDFAAHIDGTYEITVDTPNPDALSIWGISATGKVTKTQDELAKALGENIVFSLDITQESSQGVKYRIVSPDFSPTDIYEGNVITFPITFLQANIAETGQQATLQDWNMNFVPNQFGILDGSIAVRVDGGSVPMQIVFTYPKTSAPGVAISCAPTSVP
jgi:hypothetical protein